MKVSRRVVLGGIAGAAIAARLPAWAQAIAPQSDPWAQIDPYDDPRNGFSSGRTAGGARPPASGDGIFVSDSSGGLSLEEEIEMARTSYPRAIQRRGGAYPDRAVQQALADFCKPLFAVADRQDVPWQVTLVNDRSPNASAGLGGTVIVNAGLLPMCDRAGELAATLAHEIGHVDKFHAARSAPLGELLARLRQNGAGSQLNGQLDTLAGGGLKDVWEVFDLSFSRADETEADTHEMVILERLGVDPVHAINDQLNFARLGDSPQGDLALSHPRNADRLELIRRLAATQKPPAQDYVFPGWDVLKAAFPTLPQFRKA